MRVTVFIAGMILAMFAIGTFSMLSGASFWVSVIRAIGAAFLLQLVYLAWILMRAGSDQNARDEGPSQQTAHPGDRDRE